MPIRRQLTLKSIHQMKYGVYGIDIEGDGYVYQGEDWGWSPLNMNIMTNPEIREKQSLLEKRRKFEGKNPQLDFSSPETDHHQW